MDAQNFVGYGLAAVMFIVFGYLAWASRQDKNRDKPNKDK